MTLEQAQALCDKLKASANGELSDDAVEAVAGGGFKEWLVGLFEDDPKL